MRSVLFLSALYVLTAHPAFATIETEDLKYYEVGGYRGDIAFNRDVGNSGSARMGVVTFEGVTYYAFRKPEGNGIRIVPADEGQSGWPSDNYSLACDLNSPVTRGNPSVSYVVGAAVRDGLLYVVFETAGQDPEPDRYYGNQIYAQAYKTQPGTQKLKEVGDLKNIAPVGDALVDAMMVNGDDGIYVHAIYRNGDRGNVSIRTSRLKNNSRDFELVAEGGGPPEARGLEANACDAVSTHEFNADGKLEEVHYLVWADKACKIRLLRYFPKAATKAAQYSAIDTTGYTIMPRNSNNSSVLTLIEGGMKGDNFAGYSLSLVEMAACTSDQRGGRQITAIRQLSLSAATHTFVGSWSQTNMELNSRKLAPVAQVHWGIDKSRVLPKGGDVEKMGIKFKKEMEQCFRMSLLTFHRVDHPTPFPDDKSTSFRSCVVRGNQFAVFSTPKDADGITALDTYDNPPGKELPPFSAWTLVGVVHGIPPYLPYKNGESYPGLTFNYNEAGSTETNVTDTSEDSKEVTFTASISGGIAQGIFSAEGSYSYGVKTVDETSTTTSVSYNKAVSQTFEPDPKTAPPYAPDQIGVLFYSIPVYLSKAYRVLRWNGSEFNDPVARSVFVTVVASRRLKTYYYLLDQPELGPFRTKGDDYGPDADYAPLTKGIAPVPRTSMYNKWDVPGPVRDLATFPKAENKGSGATVTADKASAGRFELNYVYAQGERQGKAITKTHSGTVKVSGGIEGLFNISVAGSTSSSNTLNIQTTTTTSIGKGFEATFPKLWSDPDDHKAQPVASITISAVLVFPKDGDQTVSSWTPTIAQGSSSPFLLTWLINDMDPPKFRRKPWKVPGRHLAH